MSDRTCSIDGCERRRQARGWCQTHYMRWRTHNDPTVSLRPDRGHCSIDGCEKRHRSRGWCGMHYSRWLRHGDPAMALLPTDDIGYDGMHKRVSAVRGPASQHTCGCGSPAKEWAYDHADPDERTATRTGRNGRVFQVAYSANTDHYLPLCKGCHTRFDYAHSECRSQGVNTLA